MPYLQVFIHSLVYLKAHSSVTWKQLTRVRYYVEHHCTGLCEKATGKTDVLATFTSHV